MQTQNMIVSQRAYGMYGWQQKGTDSQDTSVNQTATTLVSTADCSLSLPASKPVTEQPR